MPEADELALAERLISYDSSQPDGVKAAMGFLKGWLEGQGIAHSTYEVNGLPSIVAAVGEGPVTLIWNAHVDVVPARSEQFSPWQVDGRLYGRGAYDMKGGLAACLVAAAEAGRRELRGDVVVTAVVDEELTSIGTQSVLKRVRADAAIVTEPTQMEVGVAHKGFVAFEIETHGRAAHGSRPDLGIDAIAKMGHVLVGLESLDRSLRERPTHHLLGAGSLHAGVVAGGSAFSTYPERCVLQAERRTVPGESIFQVEAELQGLLDRLQRGDSDFKGTWRTVAARRAFEVGVTEEIVRLVRSYAGAGKPVGQSYWADSALIAEQLIPTVLFGPGGDGAHAQVEWVSVADVERCVAVLLSVATEFCA